MWRCDVVLVSPDWVVREEIRRVLSNAGFTIASLVDRPGRIAYSQRNDPNTVLLILLDDIDNVDLTIADIRLRYPHAKLVLLNYRFDTAAMVAAFRVGANGYVVKGMSGDQLVGTLRLIATDQSEAPAPMAEVISTHRDVGHRLIDEAGHCVRLSEREAEILRLLVHGMANKNISRKLAIAEATVKVHVKAILRKLNLANRTQAAIWGMAHGFGSSGDAAPSASTNDLDDAPSLARTYSNGPGEARSL